MSKVQEESRPLWLAEMKKTLEAMAGG